jgi:hypothetical protein
MKRLALVYLALVATLGAVVTSATAASPLETALYEPSFGDSDGELALDRARQGGATAVRMVLEWSSIAPAGSAEPSGFDPTDPASPSYSWTSFDSQIIRATSRGLAPILSIVDSPTWATVAPEPGAEKTLPDPVELGKFALAAAKRYSGTYDGLPRVRYWQVWNEPNISLFLRPQFLNGQPLSPGWYRTMVNEVAAAVKSVHADNLVVAGGTAPFFDNTPDVMTIDPDWGPLSFARGVLCLSATLAPTCAMPARFDIWAHHPYTSGGPTRHAALPNDVSLGDLPELRAVLTAAEQAGHIVSDAPARLWVTEFSWDSNPPDPNGVPEPLLSRWVAESMYRMWKSGVSLVTWFLLRDFPLDDAYQSGLYFRGADVASDTPKPALQAFKFPFVAFARRNHVAVWGRTPNGRQASVIVEQSFLGGWKTLGTVAADQYGVFETTYVSAPEGLVRARSTDLGEEAVAFSLATVPDQIFHPFGLAALESIGPRVRPPLPTGGGYDSSRRATIQQGLR